MAQSVRAITSNRDAFESRKSGTYSILSRPGSISFLYFIKKQFSLSNPKPVYIHSQQQQQHEGKRCPEHGKLVNGEYVHHVMETGTDCSIRVHDQTADQPKKMGGIIHDNNSKNNPKIPKITQK